MLYRLMADATAAAHFAFVAYVVVGGFSAWRWPRTMWLHLIAVGWGFGTVLIGYDCPLTYVEDWARRRAGQEGLPSSGFIDHYLTGVIYPDSALGLVRGLVAVCVVVSWAGFAWRLRESRTPAGSPGR
ncbi:DUF2784 domain-containing protein [Nocardia goodfellowii]|uniref:DUF2784 domain-containing protein n=1 Tax=Nocardia goodfellowii TaxID=882446 RepID=A0ABS4QKT8_9NOCA|nr:DUF2784 domain-containing protein [Nocardia goodfellowii]MBP2192319.1 hypothetical protein [Nocardia goodfellowii]